MPETNGRVLPVRHIKRSELATATANNGAGLTGRDKVSLEEIRLYVADLRRRLNGLDAMLRRAQDSTTE
jgi:hypothetical protein